MKKKELIELVEELTKKVNSLEKDIEHIRKRMIADKNSCINHGDEVRIMSKSVSMDNITVKLHKIL